MFVNMHVCGGGSDTGLRGHVSLSLQECMTAMFCHCVDGAVS